MVAQVSKRFLLDEFGLEPETRLLTFRGESIHLPNRPFQVLLYLIEHRDRLVTRRELLDQYWDGRDVYDVTLTKCVGKIRKALGDPNDNPRFIETRYAEGYRFIGPLEEQLVSNEPAVLEIERTRGVRIVVEEETIHDSEAPNAVAIDSPKPILQLSPSNRRFPHRALAMLILTAAISVTALSVFIFKGLKSAAAPAPRNSIAVMPLRNLTGDPSNEYMSDGVSETIINSLSNIRGLKVISRTSSFTFKNKEIDPRDVGRQLGVSTLLEGSVLKSGERFRLEVRLVDTTDGHVIWARDTNDRSFGDVFAVQDDIARGVTSAMRFGLNPEVEQRVVKRYTENTQAYKSFLLGQYYLNKRTGESILKAIDCFQQATNQDSNYALAYSGLADCYRLGVWFVPLDSKEAIAKTRAAASRAVEIDPNIAETHRALAGAFAIEWRWAECEQELVKAIETDPGSADALHDFSLFLNYMKRSEESLEKIKRAQELDPLSLVINSDVGLALYFARRYDEAVVAYNKVLEMDPNYAMAHVSLGDAYIQKGRYAEAIEQMQLAAATGNRAPVYLGRLGEAYFRAGRKQDALHILAELKEAAKKQYVPPFEIARMNVVLGNNDEAFSWFEKAYNERSAHVVNLTIDPVFDSVRSDSRFVDLLKRVGLPN